MKHQIVLTRAKVGHSKQNQPLTEKEFIALIRKHAGIIHKLLYLYVDDAQDKADLAQEIQLQAWKSKDRFRGDALFSTWLYRVALNTVLTFHKRPRTPVTNLDSARLVHEEEREPTEQTDLLLRAIKNLNDIDKALITLHLEDYDHGEIAEITGLTKNNVAVKLHRIRETLKKQLNKH